MDTLQQGAAPMALADMPMTADGTIDFRRLAVGLVEGCVNAAMEMAVEEIAGEEGVRRNGYRERRLMTVIGEITLRIPRLREGSYFPEEVLRPYSRTDRAMVGAIAEVYRLGLSTRKIERAAADLEFGRLSPSAVSRMCATLDDDVASVREAEFSQRFPYLWLDATYVSCREGGRVEGRAVVTAIAAVLLRSSKPELSFAVTIAGAVIILLFAVDLFAESFQIFAQIRRAAQIYMADRFLRFGKDQNAQTARERSLNIRFRGGIERGMCKPCFPRCLGGIQRANVRRIGKENAEHLFLAQSVLPTDLCKQFPDGISAHGT